MHLLGPDIRCLGASGGKNTFIGIVGLEPEISKKEVCDTRSISGQCGDGIVSDKSLGSRAT